MRLSLSFLVLSASLAPLAAHAADYEPPLLVEEAPEYVPVEVGSGWYLRGDVGYSIDKSEYDFDYLGEESDNARIFGSLGMGYQFTQYLRGELNVGYLSSDSFEATDGVTAVSLDNTVWSGMANAYVDLGTIAGFTPYVGAGAGMLYSNGSASVTGPLENYSANDNQYAFAYSLNAGVAYRMSQNLSLDLGYQYLASPGLEYLDVDAVETKKGVDYHQVKVGLRYELW